MALDINGCNNAFRGFVQFADANPDGLPVNFSWTCTVNVDGTCTTTSLECNARS